MPDIEKIIALIHSKGLKQNFVAEKCGMTPKMLCDVLNRRRKMTLEEYVRFCRLMGVSIESLLIEQAG